ncbi:MAG: hypothetical protein HY423_13750 [Candidatus Lambdaproteobacteria bacterium]|nr:hypothetical protein [Candidatus Lambdaproteobacteria bacterium]
MAIVGAVIAAGAGGNALWQTGALAQQDDPNVVVNLTTMVGKKAPSFALATSEGKRYAIAPGDGRRYVLIFHMGSV